MANQERDSNDEKMTVAEAGHRGGEATSQTHGREFYEEIGHKGGEKGGQRVRQLIREGQQVENRDTNKEEANGTT